MPRIHITSDLDCYFDSAASWVEHSSVCRNGDLEDALEEMTGAGTYYPYTSVLLKGRFLKDCSTGLALCTINCESGYDFFAIFYFDNCAERDHREGIFEGLYMSLDEALVALENY